MVGVAREVRKGAVEFGQIARVESGVLYDCETRMFVIV